MAKFNLNNNLENDFFKDSFKFCKSCGCQTNLKTKFCIECGCKEFFDSFAKYKLSSELYCVKCLSHVNKADKKCSYCGNDEFLDGNLAFFEMSRNYIDELNKKTTAVESNVINLRKESEDLNSQIKKLEKNIKKYEKSINDYSNESKNELEIKRNNLNEEIAKYEKLIQDTKFTNYSMQEILNESGIKNNYEKLTEDIETKYLSLIDEVDEIEKQKISILKEIEKYQFRLDLFNNSKSKNKKYHLFDLTEEPQSQRTSYFSLRKEKDYISLDEYPTDPRILFKLAKSLFDDKDKLDDEEYIRLNLMGFYQLMNNITNKAGKSNGADYYILAEFYSGMYNYSISDNMEKDKERRLSYYCNALDLGIEDARTKIESLKKYRY